MKSKIIIIHTLMILLFYHHEANGVTWYIRSDPDEGQCKYEGYVPGGKEINISPIQAPTAKLETDMLSQIVTAGGNAEAVAAIEASTIVFERIAPKLGPALEIFGTTFGIVSGYKQATPQEILDATNEAVEKLTEEVNEKFIDMKKYVDKEMLEVTKERINVEYKHMTHLFANCITEVTLELVIECQEDASRYIRSGFSKFMLFKKKLGKYTESSPPALKEVRKMEFTFLPFREYVTLDLMQLQVLKDTYRDDKSLKYRDLNYKKNLRLLSNDAGLFIDYAKNTFKWILFMYDTAALKKCEATINYWSKCTDKSLNYQNQFMYNDKYCFAYCKCQLDPTKLETEEYCQIKRTIRDDDQILPNYQKYEIPARMGVTKTGRYIACRDLDQHLQLFRKQSKKAVTNYWEAEILSSLPTWQKIKDQADNELSKLNDDFNMRHNIEQLQYFNTLKKVDDPDTSYEMMNNANNNEFNHQYDNDRSTYPSSFDFDYGMSNDEIVDHFSTKYSTPSSRLEKYEEARSHMMLLEDIPISPRFKERYLRAYDTMMYFEERAKSKN